jgi:hypothetical protein
MKAPKNKPGRLNIEAVAWMLDPASRVEVLWGAVLLEAVRDLNGLGRSERATRPPAYYAVSAARWFTSTLGGEAERAGSFLWICKALGLDPDRTRMAAWPDNGVPAFERPESRKHGRRGRMSADEREALAIAASHASKARKDSAPGTAVAEAP